MSSAVRTPSATRTSLGPSRQRFVDGPIDLVIDIDADPRATTAAFDLAYLEFVEVLPTLVDELGTLRSPTTDPRPLNGEIAKAMRTSAARCSGGAFSTPMIAVAGAVADFINRAIGHVDGVRKATVNNGGDIALTLNDDQSTVIGVVENLAAARLAGRVEITADSPVRGIATSGHAGRSLSLGIADSVTVFAGDAALADAAATFIANRVDLDDHSGIDRRAADSIDEGAALGAALVPTLIPALHPEDATRALDNGAEAARRLHTEGTIEAAFLALQGHREVVGATGTHLAVSDLA